MVGVIIARYFKPFKKKVLECRMLAQEIFKTVKPGIL